MKKKTVSKKGLSRDSTDQERHFGAIIEHMDDKFKAVMEIVQVIPKMQEQIAHILTWEENVKMIPAMRAEISRILTWEDDVRLIPAMFDEIGVIRKDVEVLRAAVLILDAVEKRLTVVEQKMAA